jgi:predicted transcriptional regulator
LYTHIVPSVLVQLDEATYQALNQIAPSAKRQRTEFIRRAVREAIRRYEFARIRQAYEKQPDSAAEADNWASCEEFKA